MLHPLNDPEIKLALQLERDLRRKLGRDPTDRDYLEHQREEVERHESGRVEQRRWEAEQTRKRIERQRLVDTRSRARNALPETFEASKDLENLSRAVEAGQAYLENTSVEGKDGQRVTINLDLESTNLQRSTFRHVIFGSANLRGADLGHVTFKHVIFSKSANLAGADLKDATFEDVIVEEGANLEGAELGDAKFTTVEFKRGCKLAGADFANAKFYKGVQIEFDRNNVTGATFATARKDDWWSLSTAYAGLFQYINMSLSGVYFGFLLLKLYLFKALSLLHSSVAGSVGTYTKNNDNFVDVSVFDFVFGARKATIATALAILAYQAMRLVLTVRIAPLIEAERRTGYTPDRESYDGYLRFHKIVRVFGVFVVLLFLSEVWDLLRQPAIRIPKLPQ